ncbi:hypothetical protein A3Q56_06892 [Intoshia linei]|uniref:Trafficking protein particle complex subunit 8 n=1 Tax=Intoshia linei TaxID=1819745 RepID=A0A177AUA1_9BILA|nr:hypothetical protein A3Q56_06892 [Intoshia linei]
MDNLDSLRDGFNIRICTFASNRVIEYLKKNFQSSINTLLHPHSKWKDRLIFPELDGENMEIDMVNLRFCDINEPIFNMTHIECMISCIAGSNIDYSLNFDQMIEMQKKIFEKCLFGSEQSLSQLNCSQNLNFKSDAFTDFTSPLEIIPRSEHLYSTLYDLLFRYMSTNAVISIFDYFSTVLFASSSCKDVVAQFNQMRSSVIEKQNKVYPPNEPLTHREWFKDSDIFMFVLIVEDGNVNYEEQFNNIKESFGTSNCFLLDFNSLKSTNLCNNITNNTYQNVIRKKRTNSHVSQNLEKSDNSHVTGKDDASCTSFEFDDSFFQNIKMAQKKCAVFENVEKYLTSHNMDLLKIQNLRQNSLIPEYLQIPEIKTLSLDECCIIHNFIKWLNIHLLKSLQILKRKHYLECNLKKTKSFFNSTLNFFANVKSPPINPVISKTFYTKDSKTLKIIRYAELCFLFQDYREVNRVFVLCRKTFQAEDAWYEYAYCQLMICISNLFLTKNQVAMNQNVYSSFQSSFQSFRSCQQINMTRLMIVIGSEILNRHKNYIDVSKLFYKHNNDNNSNSLLLAIFIEQAAIALIKKKNVPLVRKFQMYVLLAGHKYSKAYLKNDAIKCHSLVSKLFRGYRWNLIEDHLDFILGRQFNYLKNGDNAGQYFFRLLKYNKKQSHVQHSQYLKGYISVFMKLNRMQLKNTNDPIILRKCPIPLINMEKIKISACRCDEESEICNLKEKIKGTYLEKTFTDFKFFDETLTHEIVESIETPTILYSNEDAIINLELENPLASNIWLFDITLLWQLKQPISLIEPNCKDFIIYSNIDQKINKIDDDNALECVYNESYVVQSNIANIKINGLESKKCPFTFKCLSEQGMLKITGIKFVICSNQSVSISNPGLHSYVLFDKKVQDKPFHLIKDQRMTFKVVPHESRMTVKINNSLKVFFAGQTLQFSFSVKNIGQVDEIKPTLIVYLLNHSTNDLIYESNDNPDSQPLKCIDLNGNLDNVTSNIESDKLIICMPNNLLPNAEFTSKFYFTCYTIGANVSKSFLFVYETLSGHVRYVLKSLSFNSLKSIELNANLSREKSPCSDFGCDKFNLKLNIINRAQSTLVDHVNVYKLFLLGEKYTLQPLKYNYITDKEIKPGNLLNINLNVQEINSSSDKYSKDVLRNDFLENLSKRNIVTKYDINKLLTRTYIKQRHKATNVEYDLNELTWRNENIKTSEIIDTVLNMKSTNFGILVLWHIKILTNKLIYGVHYLRVNELYKNISTENLPNVQREPPIVTFNDKFHPYNLIPPLIRQNLIIYYFQSKPEICNNFNIERLTLLDVTMHVRNCTELSVEYMIRQANEDDRIAIKPNEYKLESININNKSLHIINEIKNDSFRNSTPNIDDTENSEKEEICSNFSIRSLCISSDHKEILLPKESKQISFQIAFESIGTYDISSAFKINARVTKLKKIMTEFEVQTNLPHYVHIKNQILQSSEFKKTNSLNNISNIP